MNFLSYNKTCNSFGIECTQDIHDNLSAYVALMLKWGKAYNLTSRVTPEAIWGHIVDCLPVVAFFTDNTKSCLDIGSGAGFPAIVSAIHCKNIKFDTVDSNGKKCLFLQKVVRTLPLNNVTVHNARIADIPKNIYDAVTARALTSLVNLIKYADDFTDKHSSLLAIKGNNLTAEIAEAFNQYPNVSISEFSNHPEAARSTMVVVQKH